MHQEEPQYDHGGGGRQNQSMSDQYLDDTFESQPEKTDRLRKSQESQMRASQSSQRRMEITQAYKPQ